MPPKTERNAPSVLRPTKNQLFLIILLIIFTSCAVALAFALAAQHIDNAQKWFLISFLAFFPTLGLGLSTWLIVRHNRKLSLAFSEDEIAWQFMSPEQQRRKLNSEVLALASVLPPNEYQINDLRSAYLIAEDLALRQIEMENRLTLTRHVAIENVFFDGVSAKLDTVLCVEVGFVITSELPQERINALLDKVEQAVKRFKQIRPGMKTKLIYALVTQLSPDGEVRMRNTLANKFSTTPVDADIRLLDFETLQSSFLSE